MAVMIKCKMCGGDLVLTEGSTIATCEYCGTTQTVPSQDNEKKLTLFSRADRLRRNCEFDKASGVYETIVAEFPEEAEAYWGLVLCKYGIEYVDDPATGKKIPTCHRSSFDSILDDGNYEQALENADAASRKVYREEARTIEEIRKGIIAVSSKEEPYDIFICYKETAEDGQRTIDSVLAQDLYDALTEKGYRTFFARITLEDKLGQEYEPYIFAALNSAKVMLAVGTDYEYFNAVWVKNEWSRYLKLMEKDKNKHLIPCYKGIDAYDMPKEFGKLQAQDLGKVGATQDLLRGIDKLIIKEKPAVKATPQVATEDLNRSFIYNSALEKGEENKIKSVEAAIDKLRTISGYADTDQQIDRLKGKLKKLKNGRMIKWLAVLAAIGVVIAILIGSSISKENARRKSYYDKGVAAMEHGDYSSAINYFNNADGYADSNALKAQIDQWQNAAVQMIDRLHSASPYIAADGEILDMRNWNDDVYNIGSGSAESYDDSTMPTMAPMEPEMEGAIESKTFAYDGTFRYDPKNEALRFTTASGTEYTVAFDGSSLTFSGSGELNGKVYNTAGVYLAETAQSFLDGGMNYMAAALANAAMNSYLPDEYWTMVDAIIYQAEIGTESQNQMAQKEIKGYCYGGSIIVDTVGVETVSGNLDYFIEQVSAGQLYGEALYEAGAMWLDLTIHMYPLSACDAMLQLSRENPTAAQTLDYIAGDIGVDKELGELLLANVYY